MNLKEHFIVIDGLSLIFREFHALIELKNSKGYGTGAAYGAVKQLLYLLTKYDVPLRQVILAWDRKPRWKYELLPTYKSKRKPLDLPAKMAVPVQLKLAEKVITALGVNQAYCDNEESDDVCVTLAHALNKRGKKVIVVSKDHDLYQCLNENTCIMIHENNGEEIFTREKFISKYATNPNNYWKIQTLGGCTTDNVPGMRGIAELTAMNIVTNNKWEDIISNSPDLKFKDKRSKTAFNKNYSEWNYKVCAEVVTLKNNLKPTLSKNKMDKEKLVNLFKFLEFNHFLQRDNLDRITQVFGGAN